MTEYKLTPDEEEIVEQQLVEFFSFCQDEIAAELGIERQPDSHDWSEEDAQRIFDEIDRRYRPVLTESFSSPTTA
jgi:hypothetical protein